MNDNRNKHNSYDYSTNDSQKNKERLTAYWDKFKQKGRLK